MSNPRSSRRTCARVAATFHVDDEIEISSSLLQNDSLGDRVSGAGPPVLSLQGNTSTVYVLVLDKIKIATAVCFSKRKELAVVY